MKRKRDSPGPSTMSASVDDGDSSSGAEFKVFLSFRGPDTRLNFTDCLYHSLVKAGIRVFRDKEDIRQGEKIGDELLHAIKSSKIYLSIFSRSYASSVWCLRELTHMVECWSKAKDKMILPIYFDVDPDDVKLRTPLYLDALEKHREKFGCEVPQRKEALTKVAKNRGLEVKNEGHGEIINAITKEVMTKLMKRRRILPDYLVGIHDQVEAAVALLNEGSCDIRYLVIHGMGGIGKTTLASAVFNRISNQFEGYSFLSDVCESTRYDRIIDLQKQLLLEILQGQSPEINDPNLGINIIRERLCNKKVLLVIDDVDKWDQLSKLAKESYWFGRGSKIIITTRNINFLPIKDEEEEGNFQAHSKDFRIYNMKKMDSSNALKLFSQHALGMDFPPPHLKDISRRITKKASGLPLALEVIGASLFGKHRAIWKETLKKLDSKPNQEVFVKLKISYDMLDEDQRGIFLDIACYFIGKERLQPYYMWKASSYSPKTNILALSRMSLIKIEENDRLWMHDQLRDLGREIIRLEDNDPRKRSRLWMPNLALNVVQQKQASENIVALRLTGGRKVYNFTREEFSELSNLRFLELDGGNLIGDFKNLLSELKWLSWSNFPSRLKAKNLRLEKLVILELSGGRLGDWARWLQCMVRHCTMHFTLFGTDWAGWEQCMVSSSLKVIHIYNDGNLDWTPDLSKFKNLKRFAFCGCSTRPLVDGSLYKLKHLKHLEIKGTIDECNPFTIPSPLGGLTSLSTLYIENMNVEEIHHSIGELRQLKYLSFRYCLLRKLPNSIGKLESLLELDLGETKITELPHHIGDLKKLIRLTLDKTPIKKLPNSIGGLKSLIELRLVNTDITELPACIDDLKSLKILYLYESAIRELPEAIGMLVNLEELDASECKNLEGEIPNAIGALSSLKSLNLSGSNIRRLPTSMNRLSHLQALQLQGCDKLEQIPELPMSLEYLDFSSLSLWTTIDLSCLTDVVELNISKGTPQLSEFGDGAPNIEWTKGLSKLETLGLIMEDATFSHDNLATLSRLQNLSMDWIDPRPLIALPSSLQSLTLFNLRSPVVEFDDVLKQQLEKLVKLRVQSCKLLERLSGFPRLKGLKHLSVRNCPRLMEIQVLGFMRDISLALNGDVKDWRDVSRHGKNRLVFSYYWCSTVMVRIKQEYKMLRPHVGHHQGAHAQGYRGSGYPARTEVHRPS
ncbi:hypothetical protein BT93_F2275 [Corymbia citriodora subsp. variegata]|nr:hypothetical protein BT93_F2275 [Corymbia citriodora subsp. variegata]